MSPLRTVRTPGVLRTLSLSVVARIPGAAIGLLLVLQARHLGFSYAIGGLASAATAIGMAIGSPLLGRLSDRRGQPLVLHLSGAVAALALAGTARVPHTAPLLLIALALVCGLALPPVAACVRAIWTGTLAAEPLAATLTLDASLQEIAFMLGPLVLASAAATAGPPSAIEATAIGLWVSTVAFALTPEARATATPAAAHDDRSASRTRGRTGALRSPGVQTLTVVSVALGAGFGATEIGIAAFAGDHHRTGSIGLLYGAWSIGSLITGLLSAHRGAPRDPVRRARRLLTALGGTTALLAVLPTPATLGGGLMLAGAAVAPLFAILYALMGSVAPPGMLTEAYAWETTGIMAGIAIGSAAAGAIGAPSGMFLLGGGAMIAGAAIVAVRAATLCSEHAAAPTCNGHCSEKDFAW